MDTIEEKAARFIAVKEIGSVLCEHCLYFGRRQTDLELERIWCRRAPCRCKCPQRLHTARCGSAHSTV
jgi:hypothetical protein